MTSSRRRRLGCRSRRDGGCVVLARSGRRDRRRAGAAAAGAGPGDCSIAPGPDGAAGPRSRWAARSTRRLADGRHRGAAGRPRAADARDPGRAVRPQGADRRRQARHLVEPGRSRSPRTRRRYSCAGSAASGCASWPSGCAASRELGEVEPPAGLRATLRPYQRYGLGMAAVPRAGSTSAASSPTTWASARRSRPSRTSWPRSSAGRLDRAGAGRLPDQRRRRTGRHEAARFAPELRVLTLHGPDRAERFAEIGDADLVLTTYALLPRDTDDAAAGRSGIWSCSTRRRRSRTRPARRHSSSARLDARPPAVPDRHADREPSGRAVVADELPRCPACSATIARFARVFRTPIEKQGDEARRELLTRRIAPVPAAPDQGRGRGRAAAEDRDPAPGRARRRAARPLRDRAAGACTRRCARRSQPRASRAARSSSSTRC